MEEGGEGLGGGLVFVDSDGKRGEVEGGSVREEGVGLGGREGETEGVKRSGGGDVEAVCVRRTASEVMSLRLWYLIMAICYGDLMRCRYSGPCL